MPQMGMKAKFVLAKAGLEADAYATALFTAGSEEGTLLFKELPVEMLMISSGNKMHRSGGFKAELFE